MTDTGTLKPELPVPRRTTVDEPPPILGRWSRVYGAIMLYLACLLLILFLITRRFTY